MRMNAAEARTRFRSALISDDRPPIQLPGPLQHLQLRSLLPISLAQPGQRANLVDRSTPIPHPPNSLVGVRNVANARADTKCSGTNVQSHLEALARSLARNMAAAEAQLGRSHRASHRLPAFQRRLERPERLEGRSKHKRGSPLWHSVRLVATPANSRSEACLVLPRHRSIIRRLAAVQGSWEGNGGSLPSLQLWSAR